MTTVLVADDSETILLLLRTRLEMEGYEVVTAADGQEVIDAMQPPPSAGPDLLLLDAMMPRKSGIEALRELRADGRRNPGPDRQRPPGRRGTPAPPPTLEVSGYITKPIDFDRLFASIAELTAEAVGTARRTEPVASSWRDLEAAILLLPSRRLVPSRKLGRVRSA